MRDSIKYFAFGFIAGAILGTGILLIIQSQTNEKHTNTKLKYYSSSTNTNDNNTGEVYITANGKKYH
jgi:hypothetical protein